MLKLRDYQNNGVEKIRESLKNGNKSPLYRLPTGGGKTVVFTYLANQVFLREKRVLILVHRIELLKQTSKALSKFEVEHGLIHPNYTKSYYLNVQIASVQTLVRRLDDFEVDYFDLIIIDEAHHAVAGTWSKIINYFHTAVKLGVTATPIRSDGRGLGVSCGGIFDDLIIGPSESELMDMGYLTKPKVFAPPTDVNLDNIKTVMGDFDKKGAATEVDRPTITGDVVKHYRSICEGVPAVVFCINVAHAEHVAEEFRVNGFKAYAVHGNMDKDEREGILLGLSDGRVQVVASCDIISEGTDIPAIGAAILLRPTYSVGLYIQQIGRALRPYEGRDHSYILDHVGNVARHGMPDDDRPWSLGGKKKRKSSKNTERDVLVSTCEECYAVYPRGSLCVYCGHVHVVKKNVITVADSELIEITALKKIKKRQRTTEEWQAKTLKDLIELGKERGYHRGWAYRRFDSRKKVI